MKKQKIRLINDSPYVWTVVSTDGKTSSIKNGEDFILGTGEQNITFSDGVTGTIKPVSPADPPEKR